MEELLKDKESLPKLNQYFNRLTYEQQEEFLSRIKNIKREKLYQSPIHGLYHSEKVCLFAYLLGCFYQLNEEDLQILTDAAIYHDFKRQSDFEDSFHGMVSAIHMEELMPLAAVYSTRVNLLLLQSIIDYHSQPDHRLQVNFEMYEISESEYARYETLAKLLKDADALDRKRFCEKCQAALNPDLLRFSESKNMIALAEEINQAYYNVIGQHQDRDISLDKEVEDCFHSIGFDFFRIESVLNNGILSYDEMKKANLPFPRNFDGGNAERWISVVPAGAIKENETALKTFIQNGITFLASNQEMYYPVANNKKSYAQLHGLPYDKSGYHDERYVLSKIEPSSLAAIFVTNEHANKDINELSYLYNTLYYETLEMKLIYLLSNMGIKSIDSISELIEPLAKYKLELERYKIMDLVDRNDVKDEVARKLNTILVEINKVIQKLIHHHYVCLLNRNPEEKVTVSDVVEYELQKCNQKIDRIDGDEELVFLTSPSKKL